MLLPLARTTLILLSLVALTSVAACGPKRTQPALGQADADKFLFERGQDFLKRKNWLVAREYFRRLVDSYPQSPLRADAKLGIGDSFLGENSVEGRILAANEYREFLTYFLGNERADYAQYRLALSMVGQMHRAERDQTPTKEALVELQKFVDSYPKSQYRPEVERLIRQARDRLSESEFKVGMTYYRQHWWSGALNRFAVVLRDDPAYSKKDEVYFYTAEALVEFKRVPEAIPMYERLLVEFPKSKYTKDAQKRLKEIKR